MKNTIIKGTFILSAAGILTRLIGFYYRIFLSNTIGAEGIGLYQMIFPMYGLCISFAVTGIQMAISKFTAEAARTDPQKTFGILKAGLYLSFFLSVFISILLYVSSDFIASCIISDARCGHLLKLSAFAIPFCSIHGCIIGYFLGKSRTVIPAAAQLGEQLSRVGIVFFLSLMTGRKLLSPDAAMAGLFFGEFSSSLICIIALISDIYKYRKNFSADLFQEQKHAVPENYKKEILSLSSPIAFSRVITSVLLSLEAVFILFCLKKYGLSHSESIRIYGILTGMAMPFIFFPSTITAAISSMILPSVSEAQASGNYIKIAHTTTVVVKYCFSIGIFFAALFYFYGYDIGYVLFHDEDAGTFISILSWLCPFMYLGATLNSILNGLGLTKITFAVNLTASLSRIAFLYVFVPFFGIRGYLWGILFSQICNAALLLWLVKKYPRFRYQIRQCFILPFFIMLCSILPSFLLKAVFYPVFHACLLSLGICLGTSCLIFIFLLIICQKMSEHDAKK